MSAGTRTTACRPTQFGTAAYSPHIDITWAGFVRPNVKAGGVDGPDAAHGPAVLDPNSTMTVPQLSTQGTWADEPDIRPTLLSMVGSMVGLRDDYRSDGRVITQIMRHVPPALAGTQALGETFTQLNSVATQTAAARALLAAAHQLKVLATT